jgi:hypothetical protein
MSKLELYLIIRTDMNADEHERIYHYKKKKKCIFIVVSPSHKSQLWTLAFV